MKIVTWNVNSIRARTPRLLAWLEAHQPDVVCLQETKVVDDGFPAIELVAAGYRALHRGQKGYNGVAILARGDIADPVLGMGHDELDQQARLVAGTVAGVRVICVYVPNGQAVGSDKYDYKLRWLDELRRFLDRDATPDTPLALCGDFNVAPDDRDVYHPNAYELMTTPAERAALARVVDFGLTDAQRLHTDEGGIFSWWDYRRLAFQKNRGARIDHIYLTSTLAERCTGVEIDREERKGKNPVPSDHAPVTVVLRD